jgi:hypothetical protein
MVQRTDFKKVDLRLAVVDEPPLNGDPIYIRCSEHKEKTASLAVFPDHLHCFSGACGFHISGRMEGLAFLLGVPLREAFRRARWYTSEGLDAYRERAAIEARRDPLPTSIAEGYAGLLWGARSNRLPWLLGRGLTRTWIKAMKLGHDGEKFCIPIFDADGKLLNIRFRRDDAYYIEPEEGERPTPKYSGMKGRNGTYFYPENVFADDPRDWVVVCEGELDALRLWGEDIPAISPTNGASSVKQVVEFLRGYPRIKRVYVCTDQDAAGDKAAEEFIALSREQFDYVERVVWPDCFKDVTEYLQAVPAAFPMFRRQEDMIC